MDFSELLEELDKLFMELSLEMILFSIELMDN